MVTAEEKLALLDQLEQAAWANLQVETRNRQYEISDQHLRHIQLVAQVRDQLRCAASLENLQRRVEGLEAKGGVNNG